MITFTSNGRELAQRIQRALSEMAHDPATHPARYKQIMADGTRKHFTRLAFGGNDTLALGGGVSWSPVRSALTIEARDGQEFPLLNHKGSMLRAFSTGSQTRQGFIGPLGSRIALTTPGGLEGRKGRANQFGHTITFGGRRMKLPERPFRYWDRPMADLARIQLRKAWEAAA